MMNRNLELGKKGEDFVCEYLKSNGYKILERNLKQPWGEIDILAKDPDKTLVFVEVKTVSQSQISPEMQMTASKLKKFKKASALYAGSRQKLVSNKGWRLDVIALKLKDGNYQISHYQNI